MNTGFEGDRTEPKPHAVRLAFEESYKEAFRLVTSPSKMLSLFRPAAGRLLAAAVTGFIILKLLVSYYSPHVLVPIKGYMRETFQIYQFDNGYTETNSDFYHAYIERDPVGLPIIELPFSAHDRFRLDFIGDGTVWFPGTLNVTTRTAFRQVTYTYKFDPALLANHGLRLQPNGSYTFIFEDDPYVDIPLRALPLESAATTYSAGPILYIAGPILFALFLWKIRRDIAAHRSLALIMLCVYIFLSLVSFTLPYDHGPDEWSHIFSGQWYLTHLFPPSMNSPVFYNHWGWNYVMGTPDLTYWLTFKLAHCIEMLRPMDLYRAARMSQLALFFGIFLLVLRFARVEVAWAYLLGAVLVPQIAYTLTYVNGDVLSYFLSIAALGILLAPHKDLDNRIAIPVCLFVLCNTKVNYLVLLPVALYILYRQYGFKYWPYVAAGLAIGSYRRVFSLVDEQLVGRTFLQNVMLHSVASVRERLLSGRLEYGVITNPDFYKMSLKSLYGTFGYLNFFFPWYFYTLGVVLAAVLILAVDRRERILVAIVFLVNLAMSLYFSISTDYQPQGRYLFPTVVLLILLAAKRIQVQRYLWYAIPTTLAIAAFWLTYLPDTPP